MKKSKGWIITTNGGRPIADVAKDLAKVGLKDGKVLKEIGSITGSAGEKELRKLRKVRGVVDVAPDLPVDVGPPGSPTTW